ncbi:sister chromatid cohesion 1 protein 2 [Senna tora]|uniref:Sister chromatid cohesion 1 protein 2 n=1 Tax=Senna tora TaxID=362788 RepID=A0A835CF31_9FABA|nr:sister chromatid cohesion 1 protein 2 [Senna tora]
MFYSKCLISRKGPLGTIWVAAFYFNKLKRSQVNGTDIFFSVDKILREEINDQTYGVLANLLLGLVRIYSRKVEYLFDDCSEMFFKIKKFVITTTKINVAPRAENLCTSITLPPTFALDAFDLIIPEDDGDQ